MELNRQRDINKSGIYVIRNTKNGKVYIGKALCIYRRIKDHVTALNKKVRDRENEHFINAWHLYGADSFEYFVVEYIEGETLIAERELFWMKHFNSLNEKFGYNKREDSSTGLIVSSTTRDKLRNAQNKRFEDPKEREKCSHTFWKDNPEKAKEMGKQVSLNKTEYRIYQYSRDGNLITAWNTMLELLTANPTYKRGTIYGACSGEKPTAYGFVWTKELKSDYDIVRSYWRQ